MWNLFCLFTERSTLYECCRFIERLVLYPYKHNKYLLHLTKMVNTGPKACGTGQEVLYKATREFKLLSYFPHWLLFPEVVQHQCQIKSLCDKLIHKLVKNKLWKFIVNINLLTDGKFIHMQSFPPNLLCVLPRCLFGNISFWHSNQFSYLQLHPSQQTYLLQKKFSLHYFYLLETKVFITLFYLLETNAFITLC